MNTVFRDKKFVKDYGQVYESIASVPETLWKRYVRAFVFAPGVIITRIVVVPDSDAPPLVTHFPSAFVLGRNRCIVVGALWLKGHLPDEVWADYVAQEIL